MNPRYPIMAAWLAASLGTLSLGTSHATPPCPEVAATEKNPVNILAGIICRQDQAKADVGEKLAAFTLQKDGAGPLFVSEDISKDEAKKAAVAGAAKEWATKATPSQVAELYYVMGDGAPPAWVTGHAILKDLVKAATTAETDRRKGLVPALATKWRAGSQGKIAWTKFADDTNLFLRDGAAAAHAILADARTRPDLNLSIGQNENAPVVPIGPGRVADSFTPFDTNYMYGNGGQTGSFKNKDGVPVPYNIKLETTKDHTGALTTNIVVYDLGQGFLQRIPITARGEQAFSLGSAQHRWDLVLDIKPGQGEDLSIALRRAEDKDGKEVIRTSANALAQARLDQAVTARQVVEFGGQSYYISAQGGKDGSYLYYPTSLAGRTGASWADLRPAHVAIVAKIGTDGRFVAVEGSPDIGKVNGKPYKLEYNAATGRWTPAEGQGTLPPKDAPAPTAATGPAAVTDRAAAAAAAANWQPDSATDGLSQATKDAGYKILSRTNPENGSKEYNILTPAGFVANNSVTFAGVTGMRGFSHYITWQRGNDFAYQDLLVKTTLANEAGERRESFDMVGRVSGGALTSVVNPVDGKKREFSDHDVVMDALKTHANMSDAQIKTVVDNIKAQAGSNKYIVERANASTVVIQIPPNKVVQVFPTVGTAPVADNPQTQGTGTAVDVASGPGGTDVPFQEDIPVSLPGAFMKLKRLKMESDNAATASAALYVKETAQESDAQWFLYVKYRENIPANGPTPAGMAIRRSDRILVFSNVAADNRLKRPDLAKISVKGQTSYEATQTIDPKTVSVSLVPGSTVERGAWTLHRAPAAQVGPTNCVGPVIWWGLTEAQAKEAGCVKAKLE